MAKIEFLLQAITGKFHADTLKAILSTNGLKRFVASVAFVRADGVGAVETELKAVAKAATFFVGIRNDITSVQALRRLVGLGVTLYAVDTASRSALFHPKMFLAITDTDASVLIGSANMTFSGLHNNVEASALMQLSQADKSDKSFLDSCTAELDQLPKRFPDHVIELKDVAMVEALFEEGRLVDEEIVVAPVVKSSVRKGERDKLLPMKLARHVPPNRNRRKIKATVVVPKANTSIGPDVAVAQPAARQSDYVLVWESKPLSERDLNIPISDKTHATGSMLWKKGAVEGIDQRHFFRDEVFTGLDWQKDLNKAHYERAEAKFQLLIKGLDYGSFQLRLSHNTSTTSETYKQNNAMTSVSWGAALTHIAKRDLLGRRMSLYRNENTSPEFLIEID